ncbi:MAG: septal ring lytic transglycosylase RlpA family protein [Desulfotignum sp.]|nr:septal ring lytic transglycosylase RlpA family protein [Desulfotignum sp.]MCF8112972.1 septal ring lytic transglycosylase RlpA family protein [Desulfotignum sp.]MCF8125580.1 septal ring lytic transglycosylase RlpA family protein [Desulfotignum sp.]
MMKNHPHMLRIGVWVITLVLFCLLQAGCSKFTGSPSHDRTYVPPPKKESGKVPATQRPYTIMGKQYTPIASAHGFVQTGIASWYGKKFHGRKTANGETYDMHAMTAAHKTLPMNTWVEVHNLGNNRKIKVRINDRGPFVTGRIIDLSYAGAKHINMVGPGTARVRVKALGAATEYSKISKQPVAFKALDYWTGNFTVQVGAFQVKSNAQKFRDKLSKSYLNAHIVVHEDDRGIFYRVRIGRFSNLKDAERFRDSLLTNDGFDQAFAVAE